MNAQTPELVVEHGAHAVHLYDNDEELAGRVTGLLAEAVGGGAAAIVIATDPHRRAFEARLAATGIAVGDLPRGGTLAMLDAGETLARFTRDGRLDARAFDDVIGGMVREVARTDRPVWAYGEMVALLWDAGDVIGAIELESLWNDLAQDVPFTLHCGYRSEAAWTPEQEEALSRVCGLHSSVVHTHEVAGRFPAQADSPRAARRLVVDAVRRWGREGSLLHSAELVASELATNAVVHGGFSFSVRARDEGGSVRIAVQDASRVEVFAGEPEHHVDSGRGLWLVEQLATKWGVELTADGKTVWAEF